MGDLVTANPYWAENCIDTCRRYLTFIANAPEKECFCAPTCEDEQEQTRLANKPFQYNFGDYETQTQMIENSFRVEKDYFGHRSGLVAGQEIAGNLALNCKNSTKNRRIPVFWKIPEEIHLPKNQLNQIMLSLLGLGFTILLGLHHHKPIWK